MKNLIIILLISISGFSQEIIRPSSSYYSADSTKNRTDAFRSSADAVKIWRDSGFIQMEVKLYQPILVYRFPKINTSVNLETSFRDTIIKGVSIGKLTEEINKKYFYALAYAKDSVNNISGLIKVQTLDTIKDGLTCYDCGQKKITIRVRKYFEGKYSVYFKQILEHPNRSYKQEIFSNGNGGGDFTFNATQVISAIIDFNKIDNSFQIKVNEKSIHNNILELEKAEFKTGDVQLFFLDNSEITKPWLENENELPRVRVYLVGNGLVQIWGTKSVTATKLELMKVDNVNFNKIEFIENNTIIQIINPDESGNDLSDGTVYFFKI